MNKFKKIFKSIWQMAVYVSILAVLQFILVSCMAVWAMVLIFIADSGKDISNYANWVIFLIRAIIVCYIIITIYILQIFFSKKKKSSSKRTVRRKGSVSVKRGNGFNLRGKKR